MKRKKKIQRKYIQDDSRSAVLTEGLGHYTQESTEKLFIPEKRSGVAPKWHRYKSTLKSKDEFLEFASHELKTPVTSIKAYITLMELYASKDSHEQASSLLPYIKRVDSQVNKLTTIINDLLDVTKVQSGGLEFNFEKFIIDEVVDEVIDTMQLTTVRHLITKRGQSTTYVYGDKERTSQVLINLLSNAIKYSPRADKIHINITKGLNSVSVEVQDFGMGIAKENQQKVFERFFRVDGKYKETFPGLGLGLYISSEIMKRQKGKLFVESEEGRGAIFCIELPLYEEE